MEQLQASDPRQIGPYRLLRRLGEGGMGQVFLGESPGGRKVAIKIVHPQHGNDSEFRRRFQREVAAARLVNVLYTAAVVDADTEGPTPWLATEYVDAPSLASAVKDGGPLPPADLRALAAGLAEGLSAIHRAGLVHRDLKPSNVLLAADGPRVIDFGIAYAVGATSLTGTNVVVGSPGYLSPEQVEPNGVVGPPSDVFNLGAVLCYAATGHGPWGTGSSASLMYRMVHGEPDIGDVPDEIRSLVVRCMAKKSEDRPTTANILAELGGPGLAGGHLAGSGTAKASPAAPAPTAGQIVTVPQPADPPARHAPARPFIQRRRRLLASLVAVAAAAAVTVPMLVAEAQPGAAGKGQSSGHHLTSSSHGQSVTASRLPALLGVYSGSAYGFNDPNSIAADGSHVWVLNGGNDSVTELNARTGAWIKTLRSASYGFKATLSDTAGIVDDGADVWVGNKSSVTEINASDGALVRTLRVPASANLYGWYTALVRAGGQLWGASPDTCRPYCVSSSDSGFYASVVEFGASDGSYVRAISRNTIQAPVALASDGAHVWLVGSDVHGNGTTGTVTEFDASDGHQVWSAATTIYSNPQTTTYDSVTYADGFLWVANGKTVTELNASNGKLVRVLSGAQYQFNGPAVVAAAGANVLVANAGGNSVTEIDARTGALVHTLSAARYHFDSPDAIAVAGNHAWILNSPSGSPSSVVEIAL